MKIPNTPMIKRCRTKVIIALMKFIFNCNDKDLSTHIQGGGALNSHFFELSILAVQL
jgi:hypothetical protein